MDEFQTADIPQACVEENNFLTAPYMEEEVKKVIFQMEHTKRQILMAFHGILSKILGYHQRGPNEFVWVSTGRPT